MNFVDAQSQYGVVAKEIPCITGKGMPTTEIEGAAGCLYMDTDTGNVYKCTAAGADGYTWKPVETLTPQMFGAKADGVTDDSAAIQAALSACNTAGGGTVHFPKGTYLMASAATVYSNQYLEGEPGAVLLRADGSTTGLLTISGASDVEVEGLAFDGGAGKVAKSNLITMTNSTNVKISNCDFKNGFSSNNPQKTTRSGIYMDGGADVLISECSFNLENKTNTYSTCIGGNTKAGVSGLRIERCRFLSAYYCVNANGATDLLAVSNTIKNCNIGFGNGGSIKIGAVVGNVMTGDTTNLYSVASFIGYGNMVNGMVHIRDTAPSSINLRYFTAREALANATTLNTDGIYALYDKLSATRNSLGKDGNGKDIYEYVFSTGEYNTEGARGELDANIKKPTFLVMSGIHGNERAAVLSTYKFFKDLASGYNMPDFFPEGAIFKVVPVVTPYGFDNKSRLNGELADGGVNINRNFDYNWVQTEADGNYSGAAACNQPETQAITNWLNDNKDAVLFIDMHGSDNFNEVAMVVGLKDNDDATKAKKTALRGLDKIIPYWKNGIKYQADSIFSYASYANAGGGAVYYAAGELGIPSIALECSRKQNGATEWCAAETIAAGADALGNILLEAYNAADTHLDQDMSTGTEIFDIDYDGIVSLKPEYRGHPADETYPYSVSDNGVGVDGSKIDELPEKIVIPDVINGTAVAGFQPGMFRCNLRVKEIVFPDAVTSIPAYFCDEAKNLTAIENTEHIKSLGANAFHKTRLRKALFPSLEEAGEQAFFRCLFMQIADIGNQITEIPLSFFKSCAKLSLVKGGSKVTKINADAFMFTYNLKNLSLLYGVTSIGNRAFVNSRIQYDWSTLTGCTFGDYATPIADNEDSDGNLIDYWAGCTYTPCENAVVTYLNQRNPKWINETYGNTGDRYSGMCSAMVIMHIHSALSGKKYNSPKEFEKDLADIDATLLDVHPANGAENTIKVIEALGYTCTHVAEPLTKEKFQSVYDALLRGAYVYLTKSTAGNPNGGHAVMLYGVNGIGEVMVLDSDLGIHHFDDYEDLEGYIYQAPFQNITGPSSNFMIVEKP